MLSALAAILATVILAGCANQPYPPALPVAWKEHNTRMLGLRDWHLEGKLGYRGNGDGGSAWIDWQQSGEGFDVHLSGPFGAGTTRLHGDEGAAVLSQSGHGDRVAANPSLLTADLFGWTLPVEQLRYWVRGIPDPQLPVTALRLDAGGTLAYLQQEEWQLQFSDYSATAAGVLPSRIVANRNEPGTGAIAVILVIKAWRFGRRD